MFDHVLLLTGILAAASTTTSTTTTTHYILSQIIAQRLTDFAGSFGINDVDQI